jgi:hypothetical protein
MTMKMRRKIQWPRRLVAPVRLLLLGRHRPRPPQASRPPTPSQTITIETIGRRLCRHWLRRTAHEQQRRQWPRA